MFSDYRLTRVTATIATSAGKAKYTKTVNPAAYDFDLHRWQSALPTAKLPPGKYTFTVSAADASGRTATLQSTAFTVLVPSTLKITGATKFPSTMPQGTSVALTGTVTSNYPITNVTATIRTSAGSTVYSKTVKPNAMSQSLAGWSSTLPISRLIPGKYIFTVTATDTYTGSGARTLQNTSFSIRTEGATQPGTSAAATPADVQTIAKQIVGAINAGAITFTQPNLNQGPRQQLQWAAAGNAPKDCSVHYGVLQVIWLAWKNFGKVQISSLNRACSGAIEGSDPTTSAHSTNGGGRAVDLSALEGSALTGADTRSIGLLKILLPFAPDGQGMEWGQRDERAKWGKAIDAPAVHQFYDFPSHQHIDFLYDGDIRLKGAPTPAAPASAAASPPAASSAQTVYSGNRWLSARETKVNAQYVMDYLRSRGWSRNAVCGLLGNMQSESGVNPGIYEGLKGPGFGLTQWTPATKYTDWAAGKKYAKDSMDGQLQRIIYERDNSLQFYSTKAFPMTFKEFSTSSASPYHLAGAFLHNYERPKVTTQDAARGNQARAWCGSLD